MNTNQLDQITPPAETTSPDDSTSPGRGKIARLPWEIREELNRRLRNGQAGPEILPWLNALPAVKEILAAQFGGIPINHQNLSNWRSIGYQRWLEEQNRLTEMCDLARYAAKMSEAGRGCVAHGANTIASAKILKFLDTVSSTESSPDGLVKIAASASLLLKGDHTDARLHLARERVRQRDDQLLLTRDKDQRDVVAIACDLLRLRTAQERGLNLCQNFQISTDADMVPALNWLAQNLRGAHAPSRVVSGASPETSSSSLLTRHSSLRLALGFDVATTTKGKSNPSVLSLMEERGPEWLVRARFIWRASDPETANHRIEAILDTLARCGIRPKALAQDATNERYYGEQNLKRFRRRLPVILVVASQSVDKPGLDKPTNWKEYLGNQLVAKLDDNNLTLPPDDYTRVDYRLVMRDRGKFVCEPNDQGMHGDCFDADKLAGHALTAVNNRRTIVPPEFFHPLPRELTSPCLG